MDVDSLFKVNCFNNSIIVSLNALSLRSPNSPLEATKDVYQMLLHQVRHVRMLTTSVIIHEVIILIEMLKRMRTEETLPSEASQRDSPPNGKGKGRAVTIEDVPDNEDTDMEEGFAPGGDPDYYAEEDEEGRFFGGGLTDEQKKILNLFDGAGKEDVANEEVRNIAHLCTQCYFPKYFYQLEELNIAGIRRMLLKFERAAKKNQDQRSKFPNDPTKWVLPSH